MGRKGFLWVYQRYFYSSVAFYTTLPAMTEETMTASLETPADKCIEAFGGVRALARALDRNPSSVVRWRKPKDEGGSDGAIPSGLQGRILALAQERGLFLTAQDMILRSAKDWSL